MEEAIPAIPAPTTIALGIIYLLFYEYKLKASNVKLIHKQVG
jgi:hypothetical protein